MAPDSSGRYANKPMSTPLWGMAGDPIDVAAAGDVVPAFSGALVAPAEAVVLSPDLSVPLSAPSTVDFKVTWKPVTPCDLYVILSVVGVSGLRVVSCSFDGASGSGTIGAALLATLPKGVHGSIDIQCQSGRDVTTADWKVTLTAASPAKDAAGRMASGSFTVE